MDYTIETLIPREKVEQRIKELACEITKDYEGKEVVVLGLLKGSVVFMSDLIKELDYLLLLILWMYLVMEMELAQLVL